MVARACADTLCHKEGHALAARGGLFAAPYDRRGPLRYVYNWWVGLFYGVMSITIATTMPSRTS